MTTLLWAKRYGRVEPNDKGQRVTVGMKHTKQKTDPNNFGYHTFKPKGHENLMISLIVVQIS